MVEFGMAIPYDIRITGSANKGFILTVGCCTCAFTDIEDVLEAIKEYVKDPKAMEAAYNEAMKHARPQIVEGGIGYGSDERRNTLAVPMNEAEPCCQEDSPDEGCCSRR